MNNSSSNKLYKVETLLKAVFIISPIFLSSYSITIAIVVCLMAVYRRQKRIEFSRVYLQQVIQNEYGMNILFILSFISLSSKSIFFYAPLILHFVTGINQYLGMFWNNSPFLIKYAPNLVSTIKNMKKSLMILKSKLEFIYFIISIFLTLFNFSRLFSLLIYGQFILLKLRMSPEFNEAVGEVDALLLSATTKVGLQGVYEKIRGIFRSIKNKLNQ